MKPFFSVIVPIYNVGEYIEQCIDSIISQTYRNIEIILVDDGSTDGSGQICDEYVAKDDRIIVIHKENGGLVSARQAGAIKATGEYVICVDGDDYISKEYIEVFYESIDKTGADVVCCGSTWKYEDHETLRPVEVAAGFYEKDKINEYIMPILIEGTDGRWFAATVWAKAMRRELYVPVQCEVDRRLKIGEDNACTKPVLFNAKSVVVCDSYGYYYRQNPASLTKNKKAFDINGPFIIADHFGKMIPVDEFDIKDQILRNFVHNMFNAMASQFNRKESYSKVKKFINKSIENTYFKDAVKHVKYDKNYFKGNMVVFALKHRLYFLMYLYNRVVSY